MDPYYTLGVPKDCTREELKEAFRAKARRAHPDRGGEPAAFIQLRHAYNQIIAEMGRRPPVPIAEKIARPARPDPRPTQPDPDWEPDLILRDLEPTRTRPPGSPDPNWEPELILLDEEPARDGFPEAPDPNWEPDLILLDDEPHHGRFPEPNDPRVAERNYVGWLARVSARARHEDPISHEPWFNIIGVVALFAVIALMMWVCWSVWSSDPPPKDAFGLTPAHQGLRP
jgi:DnaJ domain